MTSLNALVMPSQYGRRQLRSNCIIKKQFRSEMKNVQENDSRYES